VLLERLLKRGETSGREDDNVESIKKRFHTYKETTMPVIDYYKKQNKVAEIDSTASIELVYKETSAATKKIFSEKGTLA